MEIDVHHLTANPTAAWKELSKSQRVIKVQVTPPKTGPTEDKVRIVCMSDTHSLTPHIRFDVPHGDIFIHAGDFTRCGRQEEVVEFNTWIGTLPHKHKIVIAGNHELSFDETFTRPLSHSPCGDRTTHTGHSLVDQIPTLGIPKDKISEALETQNIKDCLTNCIYSEDSEVILYGLKIYGTPWQPEFCKWAFNIPRRNECLKKWNRIPSDTDILVTHTPPVGHGDLCCTGVRAGCVELLSTVQRRVKPKYHVFGHIHEGYGISTDGRIIYVNASTCDINYLPTNPPVVFDIALPPGRPAMRTTQLMRQLKCPSCDEYMLPPILTCRDGHGVCCRCRAVLGACPTCRAPFLDIRNEALERLATEMHFPCPFRQQGCEDTYPLPQLSRHRVLCQHRPHRCPLAMSLDCPWQGRRDQLKQHVMERHTDLIGQVIGGEMMATLEDVVAGFRCDRIIVTEEQVFLCHARISEDAEDFHCLLFLAGPPELAARVRYEMELRQGEDAILLRTAAVSYEEQFDRVFTSGLSIRYRTLRKFMPDHEDRVVLRLKFLTTEKPKCCVVM